MQVRRYGLIEQSNQLPLHVLVVVVNVQDDHPSRL